MTIKEAWQIADNWHKRARRLYYLAAKDENYSVEQRNKAVNLAMEMLHRCRALARKIKEAEYAALKFNKEFKTGGRVDVRQY